MDRGNAPDLNVNASMDADPRYCGREVCVTIHSTMSALAGSNFSASVGSTGLGEQSVAARVSDQAGNIGATTNTFRFDAYTTAAYASDNAGCVTNIAFFSSASSASSARTLTWDSQYRLISVSTNGFTVENYGYDPFGRRIWTAAAGVTNRHLYDGPHVLADLNATGAVLRTYTYGPNIDELIAMTVHTGATVQTYYAIRDHQNTVWAWVDETGHVVESYDFDAWGRVLAVRDANGALLASDLGLPTSVLGNRFLFQGREYSWATGLYQFRARWYDPVTGRWLSNDPIGTSGGLNQYVFCSNNPTGNIDPSGLCDDEVLLQGTPPGRQETLWPELYDRLSEPFVNLGMWRTEHIDIPFDAFGSDLFGDGDWRSFNEFLVSYKPLLAYGLSTAMMTQSVPLGGYKAVSNEALQSARIDAHAVKIDAVGKANMKNYNISVNSEGSVILTPVKKGGAPVPIEATFTELADLFPLRR